MVLYNTMNLDNLKELGLSSGQIQVYAAVLDLGISTLNKIQEKTGIERRNIYDILNKLIEAGLISYTVEKEPINVHILISFCKRSKKGREN